MGVGIDYVGTLNDLARLDSLIADVRLFCQQVGWEFEEVSDQISGVAMGTAADFTGPQKKRKAKDPRDSDAWLEDETFRMGGLTLRFDPKNSPLIEETWRGIVAKPPGTEWLSLTFDGQGRLCEFMPVNQGWVKGPLRDQKHYLCFPLACKTTGEIEQHIAICVLLRMLRHRYIRDLKVSDETGYFKSGNLIKLRETHSMMAGFIGVIKGSPEFLAGLLKAVGIDAKDAEAAELLPNEIRRPASTGTRRTKTPTVH